MTPEELERLETKIAFLESTNAELSDVVYHQRKEIDALKAGLAALHARLDTGQTEGGRPYTLEEEKPPHY